MIEYIDDHFVNLSPAQQEEAKKILREFEERMASTRVIHGTNSSVTLLNGGGTADFKEYSVKIVNETGDTEEVIDPTGSIGSGWVPSHGYPSRGGGHHNPGHYSHGSHWVGYVDKDAMSVGGPRRSRRARRKAAAKARAEKRKQG